MKTIKTIIVLAVAAAMANVGFSSELFVDRSGGNGAYTSIQGAVDAASDGDTITVLPGVYDNGFATYEWVADDGARFVSTNRVMINKRLFLRSRDGAASTTILGAADTSVPSRHRGVGLAAVRCVMLTREAVGTVIEGFTFKDGHAHVYLNGNGAMTTDNVANRGGGVLCEGLDWNVYVADSVFTGCSGTRGGALRFGTAIRCRFYDNDTPAGSSIGRGSMFINCLGYNNCGIGSAIMDATVYNSTFCSNAESGGTVFGQNVKMYNTIAFGNYSGALLGGFVPDANLSKGSVLSEMTRTGYFALGFENSVVDPYAYPLFAPLFGDFRPRAGSVAETVADASYLADIAFHAEIVHPIDIYRDLNGDSIPKTGRIMAGCYQKSVAAAGGAVMFQRSVVAKSFSAREDLPLWAYSETPQEVFNVRPNKNSTFVFSWKTLPNQLQAPSMDESLWCVMPPAGVVVTNTVIYPSAVVYVGGNDSSDENGDGSVSKPFATIHKALAGATTEANRNTVIIVAEGTYDDQNEGSVSDTDNNGTRIAISGRNVRIKGAGAGRSILVGKRGDGEGAASDGRGPNALRCVNIVGDVREVIVQGFTMRDGYANGGTDNIPKNRGGLVLGRNMDVNLVSDCVLERGYAFRGSAAHNVSLIRCRITECPAYGGAIVRPGALKSCVVYDCDDNAGYMFEAELVNSTIRATNAKISTSENTIANNCVFLCNGKALTVNGGSIGNIAYNGVLSDRGLYSADPLCKDPSGNDYRLLSATPAISNGALAAKYWLNPQTDVNGNPLLYIDGVPLAGAVHTIVQAVTLQAADVPGDVTLSRDTGMVAVEPGESFSVSATMVADNPRRFVGFMVNGELVPGDSYTYIAPADGSWTSGGLNVKPIVNGDWYVSPTGKDTNNGWTADTPFETLAFAMSVARSGETIHAMPGTYGRGSVAGSSNADCRVLVKSGVSLVGDEGAANTTIRGDNNIRPVTFASNGGSIRGFTLTGCTLSGGTSTDQPDVLGGGVYAATIDPIVQDCIITGNECARGGAARGCTLVNCRLVNNYARTTSGATYNSRMIGCYINGNRCGSNQLIRFPYGIYNCTIDNGNLNQSGTDQVAVSIVDNRGCIVNSALLGSQGADTTVYGVTKCVLLSGHETKFVGEGNITIDAAAAAKLTDGAPSADSPLVNAGSNRLVPDVLANDVAGIQRVYDGDVDVGAFEYDWRDTYSTLLGQRVVVTDAAPNVVRGERCEVIKRCVVIKEGELAFNWDLSAMSKRLFKANVTGNGVLKITANGEPICQLTAEDGERSFNIHPGMVAPNSSWTCNYEPGLDDVGAAILSDFADVTKGLVLIVK